MRAFLGIFLFFSSLASLLAQDAVPRGYFHKESVKLGEPVNYSLVYSHTSTLEVVFPDSTYDFAPFELLEKQFFPTQSDGLISYDSAVYTLATYELDPVQSLALPVLLPSEQKEEFQRLFTDDDSIRLEEVIKELPEKKQAFENTSMAHVETEFNYPYLLIGLSLLALLVGLSFLLFGKRWRAHFKRKRMEKAHANFMSEFEQLSQNVPIAELDRPIGLWKKYTGSLMNVPLESYTTREIDQFIAHPELVRVLRETDRAIYAGKSYGELRKGFSVLSDFTQQQFEERMRKEFHPSASDHS